MKDPERSKGGTPGEASGEASLPLVPRVPGVPEVITKAVQSSWLPFSRARFTRALGQIPP